MAREYARHGLAPERIQLAPLFPTGPAPSSLPAVPRPMTGRLALLGRLTEVKGGEHAVRATRLASAALGRRLTLVILGDGPDRPRLEAMARQEGVEAEVLGWVPAEHRDEQLRRADLLLVPSTWPEPFGLIGVEAGRLGVPAAGFPVGGLPDWLIPGVSGELAADPPRAASLAEAVARALRDPGPGALVGPVPRRRRGVGALHARSAPGRARPRPGRRRGARRTRSVTAGGPHARHHRRAAGLRRVA
jgi:glycosyltransferase involved in cell wall biosynthesis